MAVHILSHNSVAMMECNGLIVLYLAWKCWCYVVSGMLKITLFSLMGELKVKVKNVKFEVLWLLHLQSYFDGMKRGVAFYCCLTHWLRISTIHWDNMSTSLRHWFSISYLLTNACFFSTKLHSKLCSLKERSWRMSGRTLQAVHPHMSYTGLCYLFWPATDSHLSKPGRKAFVHADRWSRNVKAVHCVKEQCFSSRRANTHAPSRSNLDLQAHTLAHTNIPLLPVAHLQVHTNNCTHTHSLPLPIYPKSCVIYSTVTCHDPLANHQFLHPHAGIQWVFKIKGISEHLNKIVLIILSPE